MKAILQSEYMKLRGAGQRIFILVLPFVAIFLAFLISSPYILESFAIYWWEALFLFTLIGLLFLYDRKAEERAGHFQNILLKGLAYRIQFAKLILIFMLLTVSSLAFMMMLYLVSLLFPAIMNVNLWLDSTCLFLMLLAGLWNLPFLYYLARWLHPYLIIAVNSFLCFLLAPFIAQTPFWYVFPYTYHYKIAAILLHLKPSGDVYSRVGVMDWQSLGLSLILSLILSILFLRLLKERE